jgi:hypothetical protein
METILKIITDGGILNTSLFVMLGAYLVIKIIRDVAGWVQSLVARINSGNRELADRRLRNLEYCHQEDIRITKLEQELGTIRSLLAKIESKIEIIEQKLEKFILKLYE